jgi:Uma2 family endonuclease
MGRPVAQFWYDGDSRGARDDANGNCDMSLAPAGQILEMNVAEFVDFLESRPDEERWELIDGVPIMMPPPRIAHQRIASNLERYLNDALRARKPEWTADREIGVVLDEGGRYRPEPELAVVDTAIDTERLHADRFYLVAEIISPSDEVKTRGRPVIDAKVAFYKSHPANRFILVIRQDIVHVARYVRGRDGAWLEPPIILTSLDQSIDIAEIGPVCTLADLYERTSLTRHRAP